MAPYIRTSVEKTNPVRILEKENIPFTLHDYSDKGVVAGIDVAESMGEDPREVFKTLVTTGKSGRFYVFVVPVTSELDLKKGAAAVGEKSVSMLPSKDLLSATGYVHGGCSPLGIKRHTVAVLDSSAEGLDRIFVSAGRIGLQMELSPKDLIGVLKPIVADITRPVPRRARGP